jgi:hypothetical protein
MRRTLIVTVLLAVFALVGPASSAQTEGDGPTDTLNITKVVDGEGPTGGYVIEFSCTNIDRGGGGGSGGALAFDAAGPGAPETQTVQVDSNSTCTVTETDSNGADSVTYSCEFVEDVPKSPGDDLDAAPEGIEPGCADDQTVVFSFPGEGTITVTNAFEADELPDEEEPPVVDDDGVVDATPSFTG